MLGNISFKANKGDEIAIIGSTGCGKSTLINLIPRFYDASSGEVLVDGVNVKDYNLESLYNKISYVPQKPVIFSGTVRDNICYGNNTKGEITDDEMRKSAEVAQASDFINKMENGYDAHIAQGGTNISGGQKQRLAIARAIARDPKYIYLMIRLVHLIIRQIICLEKVKRVYKECNFIYSCSKNRNY